MGGRHGTKKDWRPSHWARSPSPINLPSPRIREGCPNLYDYRIITVAKARHLIHGGPYASDGEGKLRARDSECFLRVRRIIRSASRAKNCEVVDLAFLGMHQNHAASRASKIIPMIACIENGRRADETFVPWSANGFEGNLNASGQGILLGAAIDFGHALTQ
jgi:hypothetical protein